MSDSTLHPPGLTPAGFAPPEAPRAETAPELLGETDLAALGDLRPTTLLPPREPLGARLAGLMGRHHTLLLSLCVLLLWAVTTLPPPGPTQPYQKHQPAPYDILAPHEAMLFDRAATE